MTTISLCMIVKNEEKKLNSCLNTIADLVDEIIIVDTGSIDNTEEVAQEYTHHIYYYEWNYNFSTARNFSFSKATKEYIFWLDADDILLPSDRDKFCQLKDELTPEIGVVAMKYNYAFDENGEVILSFYRERIIRRDLDPKWCEPVHEYIHFDSKLYKSNICITHTKSEIDQTRNLNIYRHYINEGNELTERGTLYYAMELQNNNLIWEAIIHFEKYLLMRAGWTSDTEWATLQLGICYQLIHKYDLAIKTLLSCFEYCIPGPEIYCEIGNSFMSLKDFDKAIFWFELALALKKKDEGLSYKMNDYFGFIPNYQLSICHYSLGDIDSAIYFNNEALKIKPLDENALKNATLFKKFK